VKFSQGTIAGLMIVDLEPIEDHRGFFARSWCEKEFAEHGLVGEWVQSNIQFSPQAGTMRGLHYQLPPHTEIKLARCTKGAVFDVAVDLRPDSPTFLKWSGVGLNAEERRSVWTPAGCAHGYVTLVPESEVFYMTSHEYVPEAVRGIRYDDPTFAIEWPREISLVPADYDSWPRYATGDPYFWPPPGDGGER
jgi:dTDP-4-dehydrorhamnose 3,5-epimerase